jgi:hypothetical protein
MRRAGHRPIATAALWSLFLGVNRELKSRSLDQRPNNNSVAFGAKRTLSRIRRLAIKPLAKNETSELAAKEPQPRYAQ